MKDVLKNLFPFLVVGGLVAGWVKFGRSATSNEQAEEFPVTPSYRASYPYPVTVQRVFHASSYGGLHGDGTEVEVTLYLPEETDALVAALKAKLRDFKWERNLPPVFGL